MTLNVWEAVYFDHDLDRLVDARRARRRGRCRAVRAGRRLVRRPARTTARAWATGSSRPRSGRAACTRWSTGCATLGMQFGLWFEPEMVNPDSDLARAHPDWIMAARAQWPIESRSPAGAQPRHPGGVRAREGADPRGAQGVPDRLRQVGPQPRPGRGRQPGRRRPARRARADPGLLPAARRDPRGTSGPGDRVLLVRRRPGRPRRARADRPRLGLGQHRPARPAGHAALDDPADPAGIHGLAHRVGPLAHHRPPPRSRRSGPAPPSSGTSASSGT